MQGKVKSSFLLLVSLYAGLLQAHKKVHYDPTKSSYAQWLAVLKSGSYPNLVLLRQAGCPIKQYSEQERRNLLAAAIRAKNEYSLDEGFCWKLFHPLDIPHSNFCQPRDEGTRKVLRAYFYDHSIKGIRVAAGEEWHRKHPQARERLEHRFNHHRPVHRAPKRCKHCQR